MRRRPEKDDADTLRLIYVIEKAIGEAALPAHGAVTLAYLARQPEGQALLMDVRSGCSFGRSQASRVADALEKEGLIARSLPDDGRFTLIRLTAKGRGVVERIKQAVQSDE